MTLWDRFKHWWHADQRREEWLRDLRRREGLEAIAPPLSTKEATWPLRVK